MKRAAPAESRGRTWFRSLAGELKLNPAPRSVLVKDAILGHEPTRYLSVVPYTTNRFPRVRRGEMGLEEAWTLAAYIREAIALDKDSAKRPIVALVDVPSQAYGRREETLGIYLAFAAAVDAYATARLAGHPVIALIVGGAFSGAFLAHGYQANIILALDVPDVSVHAMGKGAAARIMRRSVGEFEETCGKVIPMSYSLKSYAKLGALHKLIPTTQPDLPCIADVERVKAELIAAIAEARSGPRDLTNRLQSKQAAENRAASLEVRRKLTEQWSKASRSMK